MNSTLQGWLIIGKCWIINLRDKSSAVSSSWFQQGWDGLTPDQEKGKRPVAAALDAVAGISYVLFHTFTSRLKNMKH